MAPAVCTNLYFHPRRNQLEKFPPLQTKIQRRGYIDEPFACLSIKDGHEIILGRNMRVHLSGQKLIDQILRETFGQVRLRPVDPVIPVSRAGVWAGILLEDYAGDVVLFPKSDT